MDALRSPCLGSSRRTSGRVCSLGRELPDIRLNQPAARPTGPFPPHNGTREALHVKLRKHSTALIATGIAGAMVLAACSSGNSSNNSGGTTAKQGGRVVYGESTDWPENLFPFISSGNAT